MSDAPRAPASDPLWSAIETAKFADEADLARQLVATADLSTDQREAISEDATDLVRRIRQSARPGMMEMFLAEYGLSTQEGIALMCLAEALLRVPDADTIDDLIEDKIAPSDWGKHLGESASSLVNASTWALMLTGRVLDEPSPGIASYLHAAVRRLGEPVIRAAVGRAMKEMGRQFVLGETIDAALKRARTAEARGFTYSYDMLGEAAMTAADAARYRDAYARAIAAIAGAAQSDQVADNPGISVKLSALHPRYEVAQEDRVMAELVPVVADLAAQAARAGMGFNIDAEEADRLVLSLKVIKAVLADPRLAGWDGFGVVVQAYGRRAGPVLDWLYALATELDRKIMVRLVKGAYWDSEIKRAQVEGMPGFPVFTRKQTTDASYIANARRLFGMTDRIYPQFATHNAHTVAAILHMAGDRPFEFQRLHGMGERLHDLVLDERGTRCRIYAPVGAHRDLLAYLVRRLLENGANSSFVNQIVDEEVPAEEVAACPLTAVEALGNDVANPGIPLPRALFAPRRENSQGFDLSDDRVLAGIFDARDRAAPVPQADGDAVTNPANGEIVGHQLQATKAEVAAALDTVRPWDAPAGERAAILNRAADLYKADAGAIFALLAREAGKTLPDAVAELREAVDFLRYYATGAAALDRPALGVVAAISPWNFPLAIFTGQVAAALAAGNGVLAKPAEETPLIAAHAVRLLHQAGVPEHVLQLLAGPGEVVGAALTADPRVSGVVFTGSTETARIIRRSMAAHLAPDAPLIAETGGLNAMIVDSTALPEQAVRDIVNGAFRSAGQRCSALRCLYVQEDVAPHLTRMLTGAMDQLRLGDPWQVETDVGPVIDESAKAGITAHIEAARAEGRVLHQLDAPAKGSFVPPTLIRVKGIADLEREVFGPVLHLATFKSADLDRVVDDINATGYGLTFGLHTRIDGRVQEMVDRVHAGNIYVNRNQIGAVVGSQPFGGEGLSGTGPKAGGPEYLNRFTRPKAGGQAGQWSKPADLAALRRALSGQPKAAVIAEETMPGPTGELNRLTVVQRAPLLCLGPGLDAAKAQAELVRGMGGVAVTVDGDLAPADLTGLQGISGVIWWGDAERARAYAEALAARPGPILPLISAAPDAGHVGLERHLCADTTAAGGNAALLAQSEP
ncbi:bifunctional proline dehydrogenase/L-glutamate gamma-semialdehyde dehydrogenase PutA [Paracoccus pacificus]|uniref:Bifunctional protein PutA n=1 Tax=Paracoccus pacificus TaxID=1463598 RepID=A0ABW4R6S9_9RHOB